MSGILQALLAGFGAVTDEYFKYVTMLLPGNGTNGAQNNTFLDSSTNNFTITRNGNTTQGTFTPYGNNWSNYFDPSGDYLTATKNAAYEIGSGDFTVEAWIFPTEGGSLYNSGVFSYGASSSLNGYLFGITGSNAGGTLNRVMFEYNYDGTLYTSTSGVTLNAWNHIAVSRSGSNIYVFLNGNLQSTTSTSKTANTNAGDVSVIGSESYDPGSTNRNFRGYISNLRLVKGTAVYTAAFTPPTAPLTAITNTSLLTCQSNRFIDNSTNAFTITRNGDVSIQRFSPFNPTAPYAAGTDGGSGYFDGTGDYLNTPTTGQFAPAGDFTIAVWYYPTTLSTNNIVIANYTADLTTDWQINVTSTGSIEFYTNGNPIRISGGSVKAGAWNYIVLARSGSTLTGYLNGTSIGTYTQSGTFGSATKTIWVGSRPFSGSPLPITGYISDVKLIDGSAVTTVPTAPQTATTGTNLLLSFTNAGIIDNAEMNNLETVGNAQISTAQSKFGGASMYFDGSGDRLVFPFSPWLQMGSGDWTIECWIYFASAPGGGSYYGIYSNRAAVANYSPIAIFINSSRQIEAYFSTSGSSWTSSLTTSGVISTSTWTHIAIVRSGSTVKVYFNGTVDANTATISGALFTNTSQLFIGGEAGGNDLNGYLDDYRITKGYARYTANFTAPTAPFPLS